MVRWRAEGIDVSTGEAVELEDPGSGEPITVPGRFLLPGLVDAHAHLSLAFAEEHEHGRPETVAANLAAQLAAGVLVVRDVGAVPGCWVGGPHHPREAPLVLAAGRFLAPPGRYIPGLYEGVDELLEAAIVEIGRGARWLKVIADFPTALPPAPDQLLDPPRTFDIERIAELVDLAHSFGVRVAAHTTGRIADELVDAGVDSIEHGTSMTPAAIDALGRRGGAWTPTLSATCMAFGGDVERAHRQLGEHLEAAVDAGVVILAGTDTTPHGSVWQETVHLAACIGPERALAAASWAARDWLGITTDPGDPLSVVTYDADPRDDPDTLSRPTAIIHAGHRVR